VLIDRSLRYLLMPRIIGLDGAFLRTFAHGVKACRSFDTRLYFAAVHKLIRCRCFLGHSARVYSSMTSVAEGKRAAAYFAVDEHIKVYVVCSQVFDVLAIVFCIHGRVISVNASDEGG